MKILIFQLQAPPMRRIGAELYNLSLAQYLQHQGHETQIVALEGWEEYQHEGITINSKQVDTFNPDIVIMNVELRSRVWHWLRQVKLTQKVKLIGIQHNFMSAPKDEKTYKWDGMIYNSDHMLTVSSNTTRNKYVIYPPLTIPTPKTISKGENILLVGGNVEKGVREAIETAEQHPKYKFTIVSSGWGNQITQVDTVNISLLPHADDITPILKQSRILLLPSKFESWGMIASEAALYGIPTITYDDLHGVREALGESAIYLERGQWVEQVGEYLDMKPSLKPRKQVKSQEKKRIKQLESFDDFLNSVMDS